MPDLTSPQSARTDITSLQETFITWLLMSKPDRAAAGLPLTQSGLAEMLGRSEATLSMWKKNEKFQRMMNRMVRSNFGAERLGKVIDSLFDIATALSGPGLTAAASVAAAKTLLNWFEAGDKMIEGADLESMSHEDLQTLARKVLAETAE